FRKMWPKLLRASVTEAIGERTEAATSAPPSAEVSKFIEAADSGRAVEADAAGDPPPGRKKGGGRGGRGGEGAGAGARRTRGGGPARAGPAGSTETISRGETTDLNTDLDILGRRQCRGDAAVPPPPRVRDAPARRAARPTTLPGSRSRAPGWRGPAVRSGGETLDRDRSPARRGSA